jgi:putative DNA primase/helicase
LSRFAGETSEHTSERGFTWCLPYDHDPLATCNPITTWLKEAAGDDEDTVQLLRAYLRAVLLRRVKMEKFLEIIGAAGTGKGTFLRLAQAMVGTTNTYVTSLRLLEQSRFEMVNLIDKQLVVITDEERWAASVSGLKAITGEDTLRGERKFEKPFTFTNQAMVIVAANEPIQSPDYTSGLARRRITVEFRHHPKAIRDLIHFDEQGHPAGELADSLPGLINWVIAMDEAQMVSRLREPTSVSLSKTKARMLIETNSLAAWAQERLIIGKADTKTYVGVAEELEWQQGFKDEDTLLYPNYCGYMQRANFKPIALTRFSALLEDLCHNQLRMEHVFRHRDSGGVHLVGIRLRTPRDRDIDGFIDIAITSSGTVQDAVDSMKGSRPENADNVDYADLFTNEFPEELLHALEFPKKSAYPTYSALPGTEPSINPSRPYSARGDATTATLNRLQKHDGWVYGNRQL